MSLAKLGTMSVVVTRYSTGIQTRFKSSQTLTTLRHTPVKVQQGSLSLTIQCRSIKEQRDLVAYLRQHQVSCIGTGKITPLRFTYPAAHLDVLGFVANIPGGGERFVYAPQLQIQMLLVKDLVNSLATSSSQADPWQDLYEDDEIFSPPTEESYVPPFPYAPDSQGPTYHSWEIVPDYSGGSEG